MKKIPFQIELKDATLLISNLTKVRSAILGVNLQIREMQEISKNAHKERLQLLPQLEDTSKTKTEIKAISDEISRLDKVIAVSDNKTERFVKLQKELQASSRNLNKQLKDVTNTFDKFNRKIPKSSLRGMELEMRKLKDELSVTSKEALKTKASLEKLARIRHLNTEIKKLRGTFKQLNTDTRTFRTAFTQSMRGSQTAIFDFRSGLNSLLTAQGSTRAQLGSMAGSFVKLGVPIMAGVQALRLFKAAISDAYRIMTDFEQANADLASIMLKPISTLGALRDMAIEVGARTAFTATQMTKMEIELAKLGFKEEQILEMGETLANFAIAVNASIPEAAETAGAALRAFGLKANEMKRVVSVLAVSTTKSALTFEKLRNSVSNAFPVANAFNFTIEDTTTLLAALSNAGFEASKASVAVRNMFLHLVDPAGELAQRIGFSVNNFDDMIRAFKKLRDENVGLAEALDLTDKRSVAAFETFLDNVGTMKALRNELNAVNDELKFMAQTRLKTIKGKVILVNSEWERLILTLSNSDKNSGLIGFWKGVLDGTKDSLDALSDYSAGFNTFYEYLSRLLNPINPEYKIKADINERLIKERKKLQSVINKYREVLINDSKSMELLNKQLGKGFLNNIENINIERLREITKVISEFYAAPLRVQKYEDLKVRYANALEDYDKFLNDARRLGINVKNKISDAERNIFYHSKKELDLLLAYTQEISNKIEKYKEDLKKYDIGSITELTKRVALLKTQIEHHSTKESVPEHLVKAFNKANLELEKAKKKLLEFNLELYKTDDSKYSIKKRINLFKRLEEDKLNITLDRLSKEVKSEKQLTAYKELEKQKMLQRVYEYEVLQYNKAGDAYVEQLHKAELNLQKVIDKKRKLQIKVEFLVTKEMINNLSNKASKIAESISKNQEELDRRLNVIRLTAQSKELEKELANIDISNLQKIEKEKKLQEILKKIRIEQGYVNTNYDNRKENVDKDKLNKLKRVLDDIRNLDVLSNTFDLDYEQKLIEKKEIELQATIEYLNLELDAKRNAGEETYNIEAEIAAKEIELSKIKNKEMLRHTRDRMREWERYNERMQKNQSDMFKKMGNSLGTFIFDVANDSEDALTTFAKNVGSAMLELVEKQLMSMVSQIIAQPDSVATLGATAIPRTAIMLSVLSGLFASVRGLIKSYEAGGILEEPMIYAYGGLLESSNRENQRTGRKNQFVSQYTYRREMRRNKSERREQYRNFGKSPWSFSFPTVSDSMGYGTIISGPSHAFGGVKIPKLQAEVQGGEAIINKRSTGMFLDLLSAINYIGGGKRFKNISNQSIRLEKMLKFEQGGLLPVSNLLRRDISIVNPKDYKKSVDTTQFLDNLSKLLIYNQEELILEIIDKVRSGIIVGLDEHNRLQDIEKVATKRSLL